MKKAEKKITNAISSIALKSAKLAAGTASMCTFCQPKEPKMLKNIK